MKFQNLTQLSAALAALISPLSAGITLGPVKGQPGESVRLVSRSETPGGTIERSINGQYSSGTISITRDRDLVWTFRAPTEDGTKRGMVRVPNITTTTVTKLHGKSEKISDTSPLNGKMFSMEKSATSDWKFQLDGSVPFTRIKSEIDELTVYLKREWYPSKVINLGDSWEFDPAWIKLVIEKDLSEAKTIGTMRLRQIRRAQNREIALIDVTVRSTGTNFKSDGSELEAAIDLSGEMLVNLSTNLDESLELKGTISFTSGKSGEINKIKLPINLSVTKSFIRDSATR